MTEGVVIWAGVKASSTFLWLFWLLILLCSSDVMYGIWYGYGDGGAERLLWLLLVFTFGMGWIVLGMDALVIFAGWEMIGVSSFLLVGYYGGTRSEAMVSSLKALGYNVLGDVALLMVILVCMTWEGGSSLWLMGMDTVGGIGVGVLMGGWCKSALFGMHGWLLDAMEGPTPVSALLHSATLVTAGVLVVLKFSGLWYGTSTVLLLFFLSLVSVVVAALHALWLLDVKRVVASSTCLHMAVSFLGMACGCMGGVMHYLLLHGLVKALLFFIVGTVIHECWSQDVRRASSADGLLVILTLGSLIVTGVCGSSLGLFKDLLVMEGVMSGLWLLGLLIFLAQLYGVGLVMSLRLSVSSRYSGSLGMLLLFCSLLGVGGVYGQWEGMMVVEWFDLGLFPYGFLLLLGWMLREENVSRESSDLGVLHVQWLQRLFVELFLSRASAQSLSFFSYPVSHGYLLFPLSVRSSLRRSFHRRDPSSHSSVALSGSSSSDACR
jgi:NADH:ubiquinone oxidoreductase subunit 5 (subunit L)/multisubunit Na+/H+ antiporter MnhA subunit